MTENNPSFAIIPADVFADERLSKTDLRVLGAILTFRNRDTNLCWPSRQQIAKITGLPVCKISTATTRLVRFGWLSKEGDGGRGKPVRYRFHIVDLESPVTITSAVSRRPKTVTDPVVNETKTVTRGVTVNDAKTVTKEVTVTESETVTDSVTQTPKRVTDSVTKRVTDSVTPIEQTKEQTIRGTDQGERTRARTRDAHAPRRETSRTRGTRLPDDWSPPDDWITWALQEQPTWTNDHCMRVADQFRDYWIAVPGQRGTKRDWLATWRNWVRREGPMRQAGARGGGPAYRSAEWREDRNRQAAAAFLQDTPRRTSQGLIIEGTAEKETTSDERPRQAALR